MSAQLRETAGELAGLLWREYTLYRERSGTVVIRGPHVERWISLSPTGGQDQVLIRAGRILDGGTTAPARSETVADLTGGRHELAAVCRRLLAETAVDAASDGAPRPSRPGRAKKATTRRSRKPARSGRHTGMASWLVILAVLTVVALCVRGVVAAL
ncbi:hypothetical protein N4G70_07715 [Streptomyces sp. ASQP_92]|uniref:hypothetical protein n=1 Tax=Streptomyces sp. ASQP_92 TaxID=2979116 RepID=UPI0021BF71AD|nr:hypothetical protein [Streptomyces sp. ASQP_92]MCT9088756.1 hypothetical protein [Streptomyces sp. ASQP_92]